MGLLDKLLEKQNAEDPRKRVQPEDENQPAEDPKSYGDSVPMAAGLRNDQKQAATGFQEQDLPDVKGYLAKKYNLADQYKRLSDDDADVKAARDQAGKDKRTAGIFQGLSTMFAGKGHTDSGFYDSLRSQADEKTRQAEDDRKHRLSEFLTVGKLKEQDQTRERKDGEYTELNDPTSNKSKLYTSMALSRVKNLANEATKAGDKDGAAQLSQLAGELQSGKYSASDINDMKVLDKVDYKDILNNKAAASRMNSQLGAEDRRLTAQKFNFVRTLRDDVAKDPLMKEAAAGRVALEKATSAIASGGPIGDEALLVAWQKGMDPISVVREGEFARTEAGQGLIRQYQFAVQKALGQGRITPEVRKEILAAMSGIQNAYQGYASSKLKLIDKNIQEFGLDPELVYGDMQKEIAGRGMPEAATQTTPPPAKYPRTVTNKDTGATATVANEAEAAEAATEGFK